MQCSDDGDDVVAGLLVVERPEQALVVDCGEGIRLTDVEQVDRELERCDISRERDAARIGRLELGQRVGNSRGVFSIRTTAT
ncbi:MAG: hypothetical protein FJW86_12245 [Actinobacteria bacterium]|nr:hypothetical protein [Actinomycetota bacterium]